MNTPILNPAADPAERRKGIGGSDVAVILGLSPYKTPLDLYLEKRGVWEDDHASEAAEWGQIMEPVLAEEFVRKYGGSLARTMAGAPYVLKSEDGRVHTTRIAKDDHPCVPLLGTLTHKEYPWIRGHVDGIGLSSTYAPSHVCEFKTADLRLSGYWGDEDTDQVPEAYLVQVQWYLMLTELDVAHVGALIGGNRFRRYIIERDEALIEIMLERAFGFWERVLRGDPPAPEPGERGKESLSRLYPSGDKGKELDATPHLYALADELHRAREEEKAWKERKATVENEIKLILADATRLNLPGGDYISWKNNRDRKKVDWKDVAYELADRFDVDSATVEAIAAELTETIPGPRVFRCHLKNMEGSGDE